MGQARLCLLYREPADQFLSHSAPFDNCWAEDACLQLQFCQLWNTLDGNKSEKKKAARWMGAGEDEKRKTENKKKKAGSIFLKMQGPIWSVKNQYY